jgi:hypothetical protein
LSSFLHFNHSYDYENSGDSNWWYDGGVIEYSTDSGLTWHDADYLIIENGYTGTIAYRWDNPLGNRKDIIRCPKKDLKMKKLLRR